MDDRRFDRLTRAFADGRSRRLLLKGLFGFGVGGALGSRAFGEVDAARRGFSGPTAPTTTPPPPTSTPPPPTPATTPEPPLGCASGSTACGSACCEDGVSMCCDGACCQGYCYGEEQCCPTPREYCAENNTCCPEGEKCCLNGYCYNLSKGACCQDFECPNNGKCCDGACYEGPNACCGDFDCPSGDICTENNRCCKTTCTEYRCDLDGCGRVCPCPDGYSCLSNGTCAKACDAGSLFCEEHFCGACWVDANSSTAYCGDDDRGAACSDTGGCPPGQFCTLLDPPSHCVTACHT